MTWKLFELLQRVLYKDKPATVTRVYHALKHKEPMYVVREDSGRDCAVYHSEIKPIE